MRRVLYWRGCMARYRVPSIADNTIKILKRSKVEVLTMKDEKCCCSVLLRIGLADETRELCKKIIDDISRYHVDVLATSCAGCFRTFAKDYSEFFEVETPLRVMHISQLLMELVMEDGLQLPEARGIKVTYHDPCHLGRHMGVFDEPREVLRRMGVSILEMKYTRSEANCCGAGGGVMSAYGDLALKIAEARITEAIGTGAEYLITACPFCVYNLRRACERMNAPIKVMDLVEFIGGLMGDYT
ncbi:MAG: (Fe-S)-binding protein [Candidatus Baldrarchaeia archaeon]